MMTSGSFSSRLCFPVRTEPAQRGFVLLSVLLIAVLYFGLIELILSDGAQRLREAQRFRAVITANILAENAAELATAGMIGLSEKEAAAENESGSMSGSYRRIGKNSFVVEAVGSSVGTNNAKRTVTIEGEIHASSVRIHRTRHGQ